MSATDTGFAVELRSADPATAREVLRRARALVGPSSAPSPTNQVLKVGVYRPEQR